jgi:hypothetical protein
MMKRNLLIIGMLAVSAPCFAITPTGAPPVARGANPQISADPQTAKATRDDSSGLRKGTIEAVSVGSGTFHVYGQRLTFDSKRVKVYGRDGKPNSFYALRVGANIRFTLDATDPMHRRVAVIYLD